MTRIVTTGVRLTSERRVSTLPSLSQERGHVGLAADDFPKAAIELFRTFRVKLKTSLWQPIRQGQACGLVSACPAGASCELTSTPQMFVNRNGLSSDTTVAPRSLFLRKKCASFGRISRDSLT
jgi:hypothetical protein